eukprot:TRINITY_DN2809_c0_g1_i2.p1 TRINITY_DN2809_c0_g1~~TRINITY_DN2809_c0_g1_i2.p1  ORF type:complete len:201 (+),score=34.67 TRINITY_DN2809_c0_g1_i2:60-662(+)
MQASNVPKSQLLILLRRGPYMLYFFASLAVFLVVVGLALDIYTRAECDNGIKYLFGWDTVGADPGRDLSYADCDNRDECKDLMSAGKSTVAMGIMTIFTTLTAIWVYKSSSAQVSRRGQFFSIFLLVLSSLFSFLHFMIWAVEGNDAAKEFVLEVKYKYNRLIISFKLSSPFNPMKLFTYTSSKNEIVHCGLWNFSINYD